MSLGDKQEKKEVKIGAFITAKIKRDLIEFLQEFKDVFAWSYQDMLGLSTDIVIKMHSEDMEKTTFVTMSRTFCYKVKQFRLKNTGTTYQRAMVTLFHDMMHKEIDVYVDDMVEKSRTEKEHVQVLRKLFLRLKKFQLKLNPTKCTFEATSEKLLGFVVIVLRLNLDNLKTETINVVPYNLAHLKMDPLKYMMESTALNRRMTRWQILLSEFDIIYVNQKIVKGSAIADFLARRALKDYEPLNFDFANEDLMYVATTEEDAQEEHPCKLNFDGTSNAMGNRIGAVLVSPDGDHYPFISKLDFDCTNNMVEYEACIMSIRAAIECKIKVLEVYGDSALVIYQLKGERETREPKLINYQRLVLELIKEFNDITFCYLSRDKNQMAGTLATLASMVKVNKQEDVKPIQMSIYEAPTYCYNIEEEKDDHP
ncbi:reverse transcriptase [Gossypium australe]|uniref:Reverse transcriptase n=1 Tax=Gossypium australe TaxID=47621 RepID=A0A5B6WPE2_9ROSI|nr:reverse transcriptase [Gossypium australe]